MSILAETQNGQLRIQGNEVIVDAKDDDASKFRVGSRNGGGYSFDQITEVSEGNRRNEIIVLTGGRTQQGGGELGFNIWNGVEPISDAGQIKVAEFRHNEIEFKVPLRGIQFSTSASQLRSPNGKYALAIQDDGNLVVYDTDKDNNPSTRWWEPIWSWFTGKIE